MVSTMSAEDKLKAVQLWNVLSEKLQEIVNNSAADINALAFQEPQQNVQNYYYYSSPPRPTIVQSDNCQTAEALPHTSNKSPIRDAIEVDNSLASFSDIQCADDESIHMDGVCPIELSTTIDERIEPNVAVEAPDKEKDKDKITKQFDCSECGLAFRTRGHLLDHSRKHTGCFLKF